MNLDLNSANDASQKLAIRFQERLEMRNGLAELFKAHLYASDLRCGDPWIFAVGFPTLRACGLTESDLRWLLLKGYVEHRRETGWEGGQRRFEPMSGPRIKKRTCFILTAAGVGYVRKLLGEPRGEERSLPFSFEDNQRGPLAAKPHWDGARRELRLGEFLVKHFRWPAPNQETVLAAFEEENWPRRIDDPLSPEEGQPPKQRLHDTIKCLNKNQRAQLLKFKGDGTGEGVVWECAAESFSWSGSPAHHVSDRVESTQCAFCAPLTRGMETR